MVFVKGGKIIHNYKKSYIITKLGVIVYILRSQVQLPGLQKPIKTVKLAAIRKGRCIQCGHIGNRAKEIHQHSSVHLQEPE